MTRRAPAMLFAMLVTALIGGCTNIAVKKVTSASVGDVPVPVELEN